MTKEERNKYRILFMGTPDFAVESLRALHQAGYSIVAVLTTPPKAAGRGLQARRCAVHIAADTLNIPVIAPESLKSEEAAKQVREINADLGVVVAFKKLPEAIYSAPRLGTFNLHASLLPDYRGAAPINHAIINGETKTGITTFLLNDHIDEGAIFYQTTLSIGENESASELHDRMMLEGGALVVKTADDYLTKKVHPKPQSNESDKKAPKIFREHCKIDWTKDIDTVHNHIRGLSSYPGAFTEMLEPKAQEVKILHTKIISREKSDKKNIHERNKTWQILFPNGVLEVVEVQPQGKRRMKSVDFLNGLPPGEIICT